MTDYPSIEDVLRAHARLIERFGGSAGLRDRGALESALARPQSGYYSDIVAEAAAMWESLSQNHPFLDGNKRVAITVTMAFLRINGVRVRVEDRQAYDFLIGLYETGTMRMAELEAWLRSHIEAEGVSSVRTN